MAITVFCGSAQGKDPQFLDAAAQLGKALAAAQETLIYGGGMSGLMGAVAKSALDAGGKVHGIIPSAFVRAERNLNHGEIHPVSSKEETPETRYVNTQVESMHERKKLMADLSRGFIALPGGFGTLEELAEMTTWTQLGIHKKPVVLLNVCHFWSPLRDWVDRAVESGFILPVNRAFLVFVDTPDTGDWGTAALAAVEQWEREGMGGGVAHSLEWGSHSSHLVDLR